MTKNRNEIYDFAYVSRMDNLQAAVLNFRIKNLHKVTKQRRLNAKTYRKYLKTESVYLPPENQMNSTPITLLWFVENRAKLINYLTKNYIYLYSLPCSNS